MDKEMRISLFKEVMEKAKEVKKILKNEGKINFRNEGKINFRNKKQKTKAFYQSDPLVSPEVQFPIIK